MPDPQPSGTGPARFIGLVFGFIFAGIGLTVIVFLWTASGFGAPPLFFRIFGSFIALGAVAMGGMLFVSALKLKGQVGLPSPANPQSPSTATSPGAGYVCPSCGARLGSDADVSPKGDVKCGYCQKWFNIHG